MRNAFEILAAGARFNSKGTSKTPASSSKGTYTTCPLCKRTVPLSFADAHVSVCLATPAPAPSSSHFQGGSGALRAAALHFSSPASAALPSQLPRHLTPQPQAAAAPYSGGVQQQPHPHLQQLQQRSFLQQQEQQYQNHQEYDLGGRPEEEFLEVVSATGPVQSRGWDAAEEAESRPPAGGSSGPAAGQLGLMESGSVPTGGRPGPLVPLLGGLQQQEVTASQMEGLAVQRGPTLATQPHSTPCAPGPRRSQPGCGGTLSAFDLMRQGQLRAASRCHTFFLERTSDGGWRGHCWAKGCATPAQQRLAGSSCWSVTLSLGARAAMSAAGAKETVVLLSNVPPRDGGTLSWSSAGLLSNEVPPEGRWRGGPSVLKSALQKAVRLGRGGCAVRLALQLLKEEPGGGGGGAVGGNGGQAQLLRRLSIVCVEDAILHPGLPLVVWLMAAQAKGFVLGRTHVDALLRLSYQLAAVAVRDGLPDATDPWDGGAAAADPWDGGAAAADAHAPAGLQSAPWCSGPGSLQQVDEMGLPTDEAVLVKSLLVRASYGGMGGDVRMMRSFAAYWAARFRGATAAPPPIAPSGTPPAPLGALLNSGATTATTTFATATAGTGAALAISGAAAPVAVQNGCTLNAAGQLSSPQAASQAAAAAAADLPSSASEAPLISTMKHLHEAHGPCVGNTGGGCVGNSVDGGGSGDRSVSEAYFAARLQAGDAPAGCGAFAPASQLLAEALGEQRALQRSVAAAAAAGGCDGASARSQPPEAAPGTWQAMTQQQQEEQQHKVAASGGQGCCVRPQRNRGSCNGSPSIAVADEVGECRLGKSEDAGGGSGGPCSPWLAYLRNLYNQVPVPAALADMSAVGPLRRVDVPLSAVDFHVSDVVTQLAERREVAAAAPGAGGEGRGGSVTAPEDVEEALKSAMWLFRSSKSPKAWVHRLSPCCCCCGRQAAAAAQPLGAAAGRCAGGSGGADGGGCSEHRGLEAQLRQEEAARQRLAAMWAVAAVWADRFSQSYITRRFGPP